MFARLPVVALLGLVSASAGASSSTPEQLSTSSARGLRWSARPSQPQLTSSARSPAATESSGWANTIDARLEAVRRRTASADAWRPRSSVPTSLQTRLEAIVDGAPAQAQLGIAIKDLRTDGTLFEWHAEQPLNPASNHKLLVATAAVNLLGSDFRFTTQVVRHAQTLFIIGGGDPSLQVEDLQDLARAAGKALGDEAGQIKRIVVDETQFTPRRFGPGYDAEGPGYSYMAPSAPLSMQFNTVEIRVRATSAGAPPSVSVEPACDHIVVRNNATSGRGAALTIETHAEAGKTIVDISGSVRRGAKQRRRITNPGAFAGTAFAAEFCRQQGCETLPVEFGAAPSDATRVHSHRSAPLPVVLESALRYSNNFTTEQILRTLGHLATGEPGSWENGAQVLRAFWAAAGQDDDDLIFDNASGLSRRGRVTPMALVELLGLGLGGEASAGVVDAMPLAGRQGTLVGRLRRSGGRVRAKTGTMKGASALSGVVTDRDGNPSVGFSILVNGDVSGTKARRLQDRVVMALLAKD